MAPDISKNDVPRILIVDDDAGQRSLLQSFLNSQGFETATASSGFEALERLDAAAFVMMISDVRMPGMTGLETLRRARQKHPILPVLLVTAFADIRDAVDAMRDGAVNYLSKPIDLDELLACVQSATGLKSPIAREEFENRLLPGGVVAQSPLMMAVFRDAALVAPSQSRVLITGESGVGKEVVADVIHSWSPRANGPCVKVNCAAIPENLLESELFGHEKGAFTGAMAQRIGRFEQANDGTIFLDEIGDMSPTLQAKLLRITQDGRFQRVGANRDFQTNARILAATNRNLEEEVEHGKFREDLFYRLNVVEINIPSLRERPEDILPLASHFMEQFVGGKARFSAAVTDCLVGYAWPGNVRELRNAMERASLLSRGELVLPEHLPNRIRQTAASPKPVQTASAGEPRLDELEREAILQGLRKHNFSRTETAKALGISRRALLYKLQRLRELGYDIDSKKAGGATP
jgi:DNA-binding NtrC family response regulator